MDCPRRVRGLSVDTPRRVPFSALASGIFCPLFSLFRFRCVYLGLLGFKSLHRDKYRFHRCASFAHGAHEVGNLHFTILNSTSGLRWRNSAIFTGTSRLM